jgi:RNA recognition motif-containing protein
MRVFETYGIIEQVEISRDSQGRSRGSASVVFRRMEDARKAQSTLDRQDMNGRPMHISMNTKVVSGPSAGGGGGGVRSQVEALDDNDENGVTLTAQSRSQLMMKLQRGDSAGIPPPPIALPIATAATPTPPGPKNFQDLVLQLTGMFDIKDPDVGEPNFFEELQVRRSAAARALIAQLWQHVCAGCDFIFRRMSRESAASSGRSRIA